MTRHVPPLSVLLFALVILSGQLLTVRGAEDPKPAQNTPRRLLPTEQLDRIRSFIFSLDLSGDQKVKIEEIFNSAAKELKKVDAVEDPQERATQARPIFEKLKKDVSAQLTSEQLAQLGKKTRPSPGMMIDRIKQQLEKPEFNLTDAQKKQVFKILDDTKAKIEDLRSRSSDNAAMADAMRDILADMRRKLADVLTQEQQEALQKAREQQEPGAPRPPQKQQ